jgi:DNA excision repair protein ERCC-4
VKEELGKMQPDVEELHQSLSPAMAEIQNALVSAVQTCVRELKKRAPFLDWTSADLSIENCVTTSFDRAITRQLDRDWHRLKPETKQLSQDLKTLRTLFQSLIQYDCVKFYALINSIKSMSASSRNPSMWLLTPAADILFKKAKERIYVIEKGNPTSNIPNPVSRLRPLLEANPKWGLLKKVLLEIESVEKKKGALSSTILVMGRDENTVNNLKIYLSEGKDHLMSMRWLSWLETFNDKKRSMTRNADMSEEVRLLGVSA